MIAGLKRSGKDTFGDLLNNHLTDADVNVLKIGFADAMKTIISVTLGITEQQLDERKNDTSFPHRGYLQRFGSDAMKPIFGEYVWSNIVNDRIRQEDPDVVIITDFRFPVECDNMIISPNTVRVDRASVTPDPGFIHISEKALDGFKFHDTIKNDGSLEDLNVSAMEYLIHKGFI